MKVFKCTSIILFIFTILVNFTMEHCFPQTHFNMCKFLFYANCQNGLVFVNFNLKLLLECLA